MPIAIPLTRTYSLVPGYEVLVGHSDPIPRLSGKGLFVKLPKPRLRRDAGEWICGELSGPALIGVAATPQAAYVAWVIDCIVRWRR